MSLIRDFALRIIGKQYIDDVVKSAVDNQSVDQLRRRLIGKHIVNVDKALKAVTAILDESNNFVTRHTQAVKVAKQYGVNDLTAHETSLLATLLITTALDQRNHGHRRGKGA